MEDQLLGRITMKTKVAYSEPKNYFSKEARKKFGLGEFNKDSKLNNGSFSPAEMATVVVERLHKMDGITSHIISEAGNINHLEKSYYVLMENLKITLDEFLKQTGIDKL